MILLKYNKLNYSKWNKWWNFVEIFVDYVVLGTIMEPDCLVASRRHEHVTHEPQWNLDLTKFQATGEMCSLYPGFTISKTSI